MKSINLTIKEARFLLHAVKGVDTDADTREIQRGLIATLEVIYQALLYDEQQEKENARLQIEIACRRWPDILKELDHPQNIGPHGPKCKCKKT